MGSLKIVSNQQRLLNDRTEAAQLLSEQLIDFKDQENVIVCGIPRGGVVLADILASKLNTHMDIVLTRKIRAPYNPELAVGAISELGELFLNDELVSVLDLTEDYINEEKSYQVNEIKRRKQRYRTVLEKTSLDGKIVILTDDGIATGATMHAAIWAAMAELPEKLILALPVAPPDTLKKLAKDADQTICLFAPANFHAISQFYSNFEQVEDDQVIDILQNYSKVKTH